MVCGYREIFFDGNIFSENVILKACYELAALAVFDISSKGTQIVITVSMNGTEEQFIECCNQLKNTVIDYQLRERIYEQTHLIKELLIKAALREAGVIE
jgi:His-Xaa-Ser system protein HxsD